MYPSIYNFYRQYFDVALIMKVSKGYERFRILIASISKYEGFFFFFTDTFL